MAPWAALPHPKRGATVATGFDAGSRCGRFPELIQGRTRSLFLREAERKSTVTHLGASSPLGPLHSCKRRAASELDGATPSWNATSRRLVAARLLVRRARGIQPLAAAPAGGRSGAEVPKGQNRPRQMAHSAFARSA
jgi:hypothetical protein